MSISSLHTNLKKFRLARHFTQIEMGELLNISAGQYSKIENGKCYINLHHIEALADNLNIDFSMLYYQLKGAKVPFPIMSKTSESINYTSERITNTFEGAIDILRAYCIKNGHIITIDFHGDIIIKRTK